MAASLDSDHNPGILRQFVSQLSEYQCLSPAYATMCRRLLYL